MADLQGEFRAFHDSIALDGEKAVLVEKRERILSRLSEGIARQRREGAVIPSYRHFNQGSYAMRTGVKPLDGEFDLDVAILFDLDKSAHADPVAVKEWVFDSVKSHTTDVKMKGPCVTVTYIEQGEPKYHVDLAIYAAANSDGKHYLARGRQGSADTHRVWEESDPKALINTLNDRFADTEDDAQFRRVIRMMKRWRDSNFPSGGHASPRGIALTAAALQWFRAVKTQDFFKNKTTYDDHAALRDFVRQMVNSFSALWDPDAKSYIERLSVRLPVAPGNDLFERMTFGQMVTFKERLDRLLIALDAAKHDPDPHSAGTVLQREFGEDFPVPSKDDTAVPHKKAIVSSGNSG